MNILKNISGFKTISGGLLHLSWFIYYVFINAEIPSHLQWRGHEIIFVLTGIGIGHKAIKYFNSNKGEKIKNTFKLK